MSYKFHFNKAKDASVFYDNVRDFVIEYDYISLADLRDLAGLGSTFKDDKIVWFGTDILRNCRIYPTISDDYRVEFPDPCSTVAPKKTPEPLNITVNMPNITRAQIWDIVQQANEIKDRPVFITINWCFAYELLKTIHR